MILSLSDGNDLVLRINHIKRARQMLQKVYENSEKLVSVSSETPEVKVSNLLLKYLKKKNFVEHTPLSRYMRSTYGISGPMLKKAIQDLQSLGLLFIGQRRAEHGANAWVYYYSDPNDEKNESREW
jgi:hypothetical protein